MERKKNGRREKGKKWRNGKERREKGTKEGRIDVCEKKENVQEIMTDGRNRRDERLYENERLYEKEESKLT